MTWLAGSMPTEGWTPRGVGIGLAALSAMWWLPVLARWLDRLEQSSTRPRRPRLVAGRAWTTPPARRGLNPRPPVPPPLPRPRRQQPPRPRQVTGRSRLAMPARHHLSPEYVAYIAGRLPGTDGVYWPERMRRFLTDHRLSGDGMCEGGWRCGRQRWATQGDHVDYSELFAETRRTVRLLCSDCHVYREQAKDRGVNLWERVR